MNNISQLTDLNKSPNDWPSSDDVIDLTIHDLPHQSSMIEWWYFHAHLRNSEGCLFAVFGSFFRGVIGQDKTTKAPKYGHILTWALTDITGRKYLSSSRFEDSMRLYALNKLRNGGIYTDRRIREALEEMLERGNIPQPDRTFTSSVSCSTKKLKCIFGDSSLKKNPDGSYSLYLVDNNFSCTLNFQPLKSPTRHGEGGVTKGAQGGNMFYYFISRNQVSGTLTLNSQKLEVTGTGWYDHQFGDIRDGVAHQNSDIIMAWNWCAVQLDNGSELSISVMKNLETKKEGLMAVLINTDGSTVYSKEALFKPTKWWRSMRTFESYPVAWNLEWPALSIRLKLAVSLEDQEFVTVLSKPAFWEGQMNVNGTFNGKKVRGFAYVERSGFSTNCDLDEFFAAVSQETRRLIETRLPRKPDLKTAVSLFTHEKRSHLLDGVNIDHLNSMLIKPVRDITDRGGKAWRSYAALLCCDAVNGDSRNFYQWLALPELIHTGALIIDDLQDKSEIRRGGPTVHRAYGQNIAITAGTNAYFFPHNIVASSAISEASKLRIYDLYFEALREGHAGQAIDLVGFDALAKEAVLTGNSKQLEQSVLAMYRLKTSAPVACLARMGAIVGGGSEIQIEALGMYFEQVGIAFQIVDDVLNLKGFERNLKNIGEDITAGKITLPVAKALGSLNSKNRQKLLGSISSKSTDPKVIEQSINLIARCSALDLCIDDAYNLVESAWKQLEPIIEPSRSKIMLRVLGRYVLERHY